MPIIYTQTQITLSLSCYMIRRYYKIQCKFEGDFRLQAILSGVKDNSCHILLPFFSIPKRKRYLSTTKGLKDTGWYIFHKYKVRFLPDDPLFTWLFSFFLLLSPSHLLHYHIILLLMRVFLCVSPDLSISDNKLNFKFGFLSIFLLFALLIMLLIFLYLLYFYR